MWLRLSSGFVNFDTGTRWETGTTTVDGVTKYVPKVNNNVFTSGYYFDTKAEAVSFLESLITNSALVPTTP